MDLDLALDERVADGDAALDELQSEDVHVGGGLHLDYSRGLLRVCEIFLLLVTVTV